MAQSDYQRGAPIAPPRTSSTRSSGAALAAASAATKARQPIHIYEDQAAASAQSAAGGEGHERGERQRGGSSHGAGGERDGYKEDASSASRARRKPSAQQEQLPHRSNSTRETRPSGPPKQASEVLNRIVVSKPEVDLERERERLAEAKPTSASSNGASPGGLNVGGNEGAEDGSRGSRSRQDHGAVRKEKNTRFGEYFLGNTLGEGEFGKVKMGWKQEGGVQVSAGLPLKHECMLTRAKVAIKLIRRDSVGGNPARLAKIYREIAILRVISHPNIVRLHEMVETDRHIGIILEYASGGELFDYILNHRYLKDNAARRLFAQLVSGVGYLHKKGIVHRDLKLENLLLDRNRNIIITDFGFANTFNPGDELGDEIEYNLSSKEYVKSMELDQLLADGHRRGDLMQTSCGSPCYAAPELVVSDSLYTGRKVDVWSCGVILVSNKRTPPM